MKYWVPTAFPNPTGRLTLAGDACHPMLPCKSRIPLVLFYHGQLMCLGLVRGQGLQNSIVDACQYVDALLEIHSSGEDPAARKRIMMAYDAEMVSRGAEGVLQSVLEAEKAFDQETVKKMLMVTKGHGR